MSSGEDNMKVIEWKPSELKPKGLLSGVKVIDKSFGFETAVEEAQRAIKFAHVEAESTENEKHNTLNGNHIDKDGSAAEDGDACSLSVENNHSKTPEPQISTPGREVELVALENQISDVNDWLEALEFDHDLLHLLTNSLQNGNVGKQFIQDISSTIA